MEKTELQKKETYIESVHRWGRIWGLGGNAYGERRARLREPATSVASKKSDDNSPSTSISSIESMGD